MLGHVGRPRDLALTASTDVQQSQRDAHVEGEVLRYLLAHINASGLSAEDGDLERLRIDHAQRRRRQGNHDGPVLPCLDMRDGELAPCLVDSSVKQSQLEVRFYRYVLGKAMGSFRRRSDQHILSIEAQSFVRDLCRGDLDRPERFDRVYEKLDATVSDGRSKVQM